MEKLVMRELWEEIVDLIEQRYPEDERGRQEICEVIDHLESVMCAFLTMMPPQVRMRRLKMLVDVAMEVESEHGEEAGTSTQVGHA